MPIAQESWRYLLEPFCVKHETLLYDAHEGFSLREDFPAAIFRLHWTRTHANSRFIEVNRRDAVRLKLAMRVQTQLIEFLDRPLPEEQRQKGLGFILTLFRMLFNSHYSWVHSNLPILNEGAASVGAGFYHGFYQAPLRATARARARALYIVGLLLGWIVEREAYRSDEFDAYIPEKPIDIWTHFSRSGGLHPWVRRELFKYESECFSIEILKDFPRK